MEDKIVYEKNGISLYNGNALTFYDEWNTPTMIMCDGPYGIGGYKGDLLTTEGLAEWYEPHIKEWNKYSTSRTTLWFWCTEQGWATVHNTIVKNGWDFKACHIWDKGLSHIAGNTNTKTISHLPVVTEICVQYVKRPIFMVNDVEMSMKEWLRYEWGRTKLPFSVTNSACGVVDAATRKYFTKCHLWYMPPAEAFEKIVKYANKHGVEDGKPYFSIDGINPMTKEDWEKQKPIFKCPFGKTNVWPFPQLRNSERKKDGNKSVHNNQKPLAIIKSLIEMTTDIDDVVWEPFGGLCTTAIASLDLKRKCYSSEICDDTYKYAVKRLNDAVLQQGTQTLF